MANEYCTFFTDLAAGIPIETSFIVDNRTFDSRGGEVIGCTKFEVFFEEFRQIMHLKSTIDERRHTATIFASEVLSISNLVKRARDNLEEKVSAGILEEMPLVPSLEWVRLQFSPNNETVKKAIKFTSNIGIKRAIQTRTLRKEHGNQHWVNSMTRYVL